MTIIRGWKAIEDYAQARRPTIRKWARRHGFPLRQIGGRGGVYIIAEEVDSWLNRRKPYGVS